MSFLLYISVHNVHPGLQASCIGPFEDWLGDSNFCYQLIEEGKSWYDARTACSDKGGDLAVVHSDALMNAILQHIQGHNGWIGLKKDELEDGNQKIS